MELGNSRVQEFSAAGAFITAFGSAGSGSSDFSSPRGIAVAPSGPILVADTGNSRVQVWEPAKGSEPPAYAASITYYENPEIDRRSKCRGRRFERQHLHRRCRPRPHRRVQLKTKIRQAVRRKGSGRAAFKGIGGIATNKAGDIYATDPGDARVQEFEPDGTHLRSFGGPGSGTNEGKLSYPTGIAALTPPETSGSSTPTAPPKADASRSSRKQNMAKKLWGSKFGSTGTTEGKIGISSFGLAISGGNLYVTEYGNSRVEGVLNKW